MRDEKLWRINLKPGRFFVWFFGPTRRRERERVKSSFYLYQKIYKRVERERERVGLCVTIDERGQI
jgi:hypothetical protein